MLERRRSTLSAQLRTPRVWLGLAISLAALYLAVRDVQWSEAAATLTQANYALLLLALGSVLMNTWAKAVRWRLLFYPLHSQVSMADSLSALLVGQLANNLLPARLGDLGRAYLFAESSQMGKIFALAVTVVEKAMDSVMLLLFVALLAPWMPMPAWLRHSSLILSVGLALLLLALIVLASQRQRLVRTMERWAESRSPIGIVRVLRRLAEASGKLHALQDLRVQAELWGWSVVIWVLGAATNAIVLWALALRTSPLAAPLLLVVLMTGAVLPTSPLKIGVFHYLCVLSLSLFGVDRDVALSYAVLLHLVVYVPIVIGGVLGLWLQGTGLGAGPFGQGLDGSDQ
jgi:uncharacterized protein (TIRG00374 family)